MTEDLKKRAEFHDICQMIVIKFGIIIYLILAVILLSFFKKNEIDIGYLNNLNLYNTLFSFFIVICISKYSKKYAKYKGYEDNETLVLIVLNDFSSIFISIGFGSMFAYIIFIGFLAKKI